MALPARPGPTTRVVVPLPRLSPGIRQFLATEAGSATLLLAATLAALVWANAPGWTSYESVWSTVASIRVGDWTLALDLRHWINDAAMAIFFLVVGLEISRELTVGDLRSAGSVAAPALGALGGLAVPPVIYAVINHGGPGAHGWGIPMSTDTALSGRDTRPVRPALPGPAAAVLLTLAIVDDIGAIVVIGLFYTAHVSPVALIIAIVLVLVLLIMRWQRIWRLSPYVPVGIALWLAVDASGAHPTLAGVIVGLVVPAMPVEPTQSGRFRSSAWPTRWSTWTARCSGRRPPTERTGGPIMIALPGPDRTNVIQSRHRRAHWSHRGVT